MLEDYQRVSKKLREQLKSCKERDIRIKAELILLGCKLNNASEACARRGFSRKFFCKWYGRLKRSRWDLRALREYSRRPRRVNVRKTKAHVEKKIQTLAKLGFGAPTIQATLLREWKFRIAKSTIGHILRKRKKSVRRMRSQKLKSHRRRYEVPIPGLRMQMDVKYVPEPVACARAYVYVIVDECTRMRFARAYGAINGHNTVEFLELAKASFPFSMNTIQTDNGFEFTYRLNPASKDVVHPMDQWCAENAVRHRCIPPGEKELNGKVERSHRIDEQWFYWRATQESLDKFNEELEAWIVQYNHERLHGGIDFMTPFEKLLERYQSLRNAAPEPENSFQQLKFIKELPIRLQAYKKAAGFKQRAIAWAA